MFWKSKDKKPVLLSFVWQNDECSRAVGAFVEKELPEVSQLIITYINGDKDKPNIIAAGFENEIETAGVLMRAAHKVAGNGD